MHDEFRRNIFLNPEDHVQQRHDHKAASDADKPGEKSGGGPAEQIEQKNGHGSDSALNCRTSPQ